jgi:sugar phosphate isomerase/epimerase
MTFEFACADYAFPLLSREQSLHLIRLLDFGYVDLGLFARSPRLSPGELIASPAEFTQRLKHDLENAELLVSDIFLQIGTDPGEYAANDPSRLVRERARDTFQRTLELCASLGCSHLTGLPGVRHEGVAKTQDDALAIEEAAWRVTLSSSARIRYSIEPHIGSLCPDVTTTRALLDAVPGLTLTLDYGHFIAAGKTSEEVHPLLSFATHIHVRGGARDRLQTTAAENEIDFEGMMARLIELNYAGFFALEYVWVDWQGCNRTDNLSETILLKRELEQFNISQRSLHHPSSS